MIFFSFSPKSNHSMTCSFSFKVFYIFNSYIPLYLYSIYFIVVFKSYVHRIVLITSKNGSKLLLHSTIHCVTDLDSWRQGYYENNVARVPNIEGAGYTMLSTIKGSKLNTPSFEVMCSGLETCLILPMKKSYFIVIWAE